MKAAAFTARGVSRHGAECGCRHCRDIRACETRPLKSIEDLRSVFADEEMTVRIPRAQLAALIEASRVDRGDRDR